MNSILNKTLPPISKDTIDTLNKIFPVYKPEAGFNRDDVMQSVGERKVIDWLVHHSNTKVVSGNIDDVVTKADILTGVKEYTPWYKRTMVNRNL